jgi:hypothetical protein
MEAQLVQIVRCYRPLIEMLDDASATNARANGILHHMRTYYYVWSLLLMVDVLTVFNELVRKLQDRNLDITMIDSLSQSCQSKLVAMKTKPGG